MKKLFLALALSAAACLAGCSDNEEIGYDIGSKVLIPKNGLQQVALTADAAAVRLDNNAHTAKIGIRIDVSAITADSRCVLPVSVGSPDTEVNAAAATVLIFPVRPATEKSENAQ